VADLNYQIRRELEQCDTSGFDETDRGSRAFFVGKRQYPHFEQPNPAVASDRAVPHMRAALGDVVVL
jgi:hypothetical protein